MQSHKIPQDVKWNAWMQNMPVLQQIQYANETSSNNTQLVSISGNVLIA